MKKNYIILISVFSLAFLVLLTFLPKYQAKPVSESANSNMPYNSTSIAQSSQESSEIMATESKTDVYTLREYEGRIGIFRNDETEPCQEIDVDISTFSKEDQELLQSGIKVYSVDELNRKIEDYES